MRKAAGDLRGGARRHWRRGFVPGAVGGNISSDCRSSSGDAGCWRSISSKFSTSRLSGVGGVGVAGVRVVLAARCRVDGDVLAGARMGRRAACGVRNPGFVHIGRAGILRPGREEAAGESCNNPRGAS